MTTGKWKIPKFQIAVLVVLTTVVLAYNYQFRNIPSEMYMQATGWARGFSPDTYIDLTNDTDFRVQVFKWIDASVGIGWSIKIPPTSSGRSWFQMVYDSEWSHNFNIKYGDDFYLIEVWYQKAYYPSGLEHIILWSVNFLTLVLWASFIMPKGGAEREQA